MKRGLSRRRALQLLAAAPLASSPGRARRYAPMLARPIWVYNNWSAYDELSDAVPLSEELALRQLDELLRLRRHGAEFDCYMMDAFWYAPEGGYRTWRRESWPAGPDRWIARCHANDLRPGMWFGTNTLVGLDPAPPWRSSLSEAGNTMSMYQGSFLADFIEVLQLWHDRGIRMFKLDFADFSAVAAGTPAVTAKEVRSRNVEALRTALAAFRRRNPGVVLVAFNGFGGDFASTATALPFQDPVDPRWLEVFDALFSGDPRASDVPEMDFWRSMDIYSDHMVRRFEESGIPLSRIDSTAFMIGDTATNYHRRTEAWRGMMLLTLARGGWVNTVHGNLDFLSDDDADWFATAQKLYAPLQRGGRIAFFGGTPGDAAPYGFSAEGMEGALFAVVNPSQSIASLHLPRFAGRGRVLFRDAGHFPVLEVASVRLGPGQMALIGTGRYDDPAYDLGIQADIVIPRAIAPVPVLFRAAGAGGAVETTIRPPQSGDLRIVLQQRDAEGSITRSAGGYPPDAANMRDVLVIEAYQGGKKLLIQSRYDKVVWSGLSWAVGEIRGADMVQGEALRIRLFSTDNDPPVRLDGRLYRVDY